MRLQRTQRTEKTFNAGFPWSQVDVERLIRLYPQSHNKDLAVILGRAEEAVRGKARRLGLHKDYVGGYKPEYSWGTAWSTEEINLLRKLYPTTSNYDIGEILGRSFASVQGQAQQLKLKKMEFWSQEETEFLTTHYQKMSNAQLARQMGRTEGAVMSQIHLLGLENRVTPWTDNDLGVLKKYYHKTNGKVLARMLGRSYEAVRQKAYVLGLCKNDCWSRHENTILKDLYQKCRLEEIAEKVGRTPCAVKRHAQALGLRKVARVNAEESASASEELSAQAEQMNQAVQELVAMVGGSAAKRSSFDTTSAVAKAPRLSNSDSAFHQIAQAPAKREKVPAAQNAGQKAIPLDDDGGLDDFNH